MKARLFPMLSVILVMAVWIIWAASWRLLDGTALVQWCPSIYWVWSFVGWCVAMAIGYRHGSVCQ